MTLDEAVAALESFFEQLHSDPWPLGRLVASALDEAKELAAGDTRFAPCLYAVLRTKTSSGSAPNATA